MTEKIDLRRRSEKAFPSEIEALIQKHQGVVAYAERAMGVSKGTFQKIRSGKKAFTETMKQRVIAATKGEKMNAQSPTLTIPETCPPVLAELIQFKGTKSAARKALETNDPKFYAVIAGRDEMPPDWIIRAKAEMGQSVIGPGSQQQETPPDSQMPEFVPWNGTRGIFKTKAHGKAKARIIKNVPQPLIDLMEKYEGNVSAAARSLGMTGGAIFQWIEGGREFTEERQRKVHAAMHGMPAGGQHSLGEGFDKYTLGLAICMLKSSNFDRIADIAEILNGRLVFRKNTSGGWIIIYKMALEDLPKFKKLALRDASEIVCP